MQKKILMFGWEFPPHNSGGLGVACYGLTKALSKKKVKVVFVLPRKLEGMDESFLKIVGSEMLNDSYIFNSPLTPYLNTKTYNSEGIYGDTLFNEVLRYAEFGGVIAEKEEFDVIHAHDWLSFGAGIKAKIKSGKPLVVHVHATEFDRGGGSGINEFVYKIEKEGMEIADKIIAVSNFTKNIIIKHYGISEEKIEVVHNGIDFEKEKLSSNEIHKIKEVGKKIVLFVGRLTLQKGPDYFIQTAKRICDITKDVYFIVSGSGDMECQLIREVANCGISDRVFFTGFLRGEDLKNIYKTADIYIMPSVSEPFGITPLESIMNGTPVIISKQSGVSEVVSHALKVDFWDIEDTANKILTALNYKSLTDCLKKHSREEVAKITWNNAAEKCIKIYEAL
jgi:glycosyltransferase involved in cell wall biosynthesis